MIELSGIPNQIVSCVMTVLFDFGLAVFDIPSSLGIKSVSGDFAHSCLPVGVANQAASFVSIR